MSKAVIRQCEFCKKQTDDPFTCKGWVQIRIASLGGLGDLPAAAHIEMYRTVDAITCDMLSEASDFCCVEHLVAALDQKAQERVFSGSQEKAKK